MFGPKCAKPCAPSSFLDTLDGHLYARVYCTCGKTTEKFRQMHVSEINTLNLIMSTLWLNTLMSFNLCRKIVWSAAYKFHPLHDKARPNESFLEESPSTKKTVYTFIFIHFPRLHAGSAGSTKIPELVISLFLLSSRVLG